MSKVSWDSTAQNIEEPTQAWYEYASPFCCCHYMCRCSRHREVMLLDEGPVVTHALTICPSTTARNKAIGRTKQSATRWVKISWKAQNFVQTVLWQRSSLWNHLNCKEQLLFLSHRGHLSREGRTGAGWRREFLTSALLMCISGSAKSRYLLEKGEP